MIVYFKTPTIGPRVDPDFHPAKSVSWDLTKAHSPEQMSAVLAILIKRLN